MKTRICWICQVNLVWDAYAGTYFLDENGDRPCYECVTEMEDKSEEESDDCVK